MTQKKLPAVMFYTGDWLKEPTLRATSLAARGLWIDMLCFMHESPRRGYLMLTKEVPMQASHLARAAGTDLDTCETLLEELEANGVLSVVEIEAVGDAYASRRMVRDETTRQKLSEAGKRGGRPKESLRKATDKPTPKGPRGSSSSSSSSVSDSSSEEEERSISEETVEAVYTRIPWRARRQPAKTKLMIRQHLVGLRGQHSGVDKAAAWLGDRLGDYYASPEGRSEYFRSPTTWLDAEAYDEPDEAWASRFKERTEL